MTQLDEFQEIRSSADFSMITPELIRSGFFALVLILGALILSAGLKSRRRAAFWASIMWLAILGMITVVVYFFAFPKIG